jgi:hypothetical protein
VRAQMIFNFLGCFVEKQLFINILLAYIKTYFLILKNVPKAASGFCPAFLI